MVVSDYIAYTIDKFPVGYVFTYDNFDLDVSQREAAVKALSRLVQSGRINRLSKGRFYKPEITPFGELIPSQEELVKDLLEEDGKVVGYLTGYSVYNQLGLTTQVGNTIQIGKNETRPRFKRNYYTISFIKQRNTITKQNIPLLQILDAIRYIKKIPDTTIEKACKRFLTILKELSNAELETIVRLALKYSPATRALVGALLDEIGKDNYTHYLLKTLNPMTTYKIIGSDKALSTTEKWNIV